MTLNFKDGKEIFREQRDGDILSVIVAGDCCPHHDAVGVIAGGGSKDILKDIQPIFDGADVTMVQFETPLTDSDIPIVKSGPNLRCPPVCAEFIKTAGFDVALLANNHIGDFGGGAVMETIETINGCGIKTVGAGKNMAAAVKPLIFERNGFIIGVLNFAEHEFGTATVDCPGCAPLEPVGNILSIMKLAAEVDVTIVVCHGGNEMNPAPSPRMVQNCRAFADAGAAAVINIHTHCPQGIELWNNVPIVYSPGNFFFPWSGRVFKKEDLWWTGYLPRFEFDRCGALSLEIVPYTFSPDPLSIKLFTKREKEGFFRYHAVLSSILVSPEKIGRYFDAWSVMMGESALLRIAGCSSLWPFDYGDSELIKKILPLRNIFTCEAHNELVTNFLRIVEAGKVTEAGEFIPEIRRLQNASFYI